MGTLTAQIQLTEAELKPCMPQVAQNFKVLDTGRHGYLTKTEVASGAQLAAESAIAQMRQRNARAFAQADTDHDGTLSRAEFTAAFPRLARSFDFFDENRDGVIEPNEFALPPR
jgi:Ca2+-binding EF-hand superfamily protein